MEMDRIQVCISFFLILLFIHSCLFIYLFILYYYLLIIDAQEWANYLYGMFFKACSNFTKTNSDDDYYNFK